MGSAGRVALDHRLDVGACREPDARIGGKGFVEGLADQGGGHLGRAGQPRQVIAERALEARLAQDGGMERPGQHGFGGGRRLGCLANPIPDRIYRPQISRPGLGRVLELALGNCAIHGALLRSAFVPCDAREAIDTPPFREITPSGLRVQFRRAQLGA